MIKNYLIKTGIDSGIGLTITSIFSLEFLQEILLIIIVAFANCLLMPLVDFIVKKIKAKIKDKEIAKGFEDFTEEVKEEIKDKIKK